MVSNEFSRLYTQYFPFWDKLNTIEKNELCSNSQIVNYKSGDNIHGGTYECTGVLLVKSGCLRTYMLSDEGKEIILYRLYPGDICTLSASCVLKSITFDVFVDAEESSNVIIIAPKTFSKIVESNIYVENFMLNLATIRFSDVMWAMQQILFMKIDKRLAIFLNDEISKTQNSTINLTHDQIAKHIGSAREVVSRMLKNFSNEGIVDVARGGITVINKEKLKNLIRY